MLILAPFNERISLRALLTKSEVRFTRPFFHEAPEVSLDEDEAKAVEDFEKIYGKRPSKRPREAESETAVSLLQISGKADVRHILFYDDLLPRCMPCTTSC